MDWYKVKVSHTLYDNMNDRDFRAWHRIMALTAQLEKMPTSEQFLTVCTQKRVESLSEFFRKHDKSLSEICQKVLEDATEVCKKREYFKIKKRQEREKLQNVNLTSQTPNWTVNPQIREDKIRENKIIENTTNTSSDGFKFYMSNINPMINQYESEQVKFLIDTYSEDWFIKACQVAVVNNVRKLKYIEGVLKKSKDNGNFTEKKQTYQEKRKIVDALEEKLRKEGKL